MTDTSEPPKRPPSPRPPGRGDRPERGSERPRARPEGASRGAPDNTRGAGRRDPAAKTRGVEPAPAKDDARIAKVMARAGLCSRRDAEGWIAAGRVAVNGAVIDSPALNVGPGDRITVDGQPLPERERTRLFLFHKPRGLVTTARDPEGRPTIFEELPDALPRVVSVGRLDINTEGLMLLTNDGGLARVLELPATGWLRRYRVRANGAIDQARLDTLKGGVTIDGVDYAGIEATLDRLQGANLWLTMGLREGKNREIKRVLESLGLAVTRLIRVSFGPFQLGELAEGAVEAVPNRVLREQLGPGLAAQAGVDLDAPEEPAGRRSGRAGDEAAPARPSRAEPGLPRPHVAAMRAARAETAGDGRKRIERGATADRRGRTVKVERVIPVGAGSERGEGRNARRFAAEKDGLGAGRQRTHADAGDARPARGTAMRTRRDEDVRPVRGAPTKTRPDDDARPARSTMERTRRDDRTRPARSMAEKTRRDDNTRPARDATARARPDDDARPARGAAARTRRDDGARPAREGGAGFGAAPRREARSEVGSGARPFGPRGTAAGDGGRGEGKAGVAVRTADPRSERPAAARPFSGKPNGRPGGFGSERPATGRNKPGGARPAPGGFKSGRPAAGESKGGRPAAGESKGGRPAAGEFKGGRPAAGGGPRGDGRPPRGSKPPGGRPPRGGP